MNAGLNVHPSRVLSDPQGNSDGSTRNLTTDPGLHGDRLTRERASRLNSAHARVLGWRLALSALPGPCLHQGPSCECGAAPGGGALVTHMDFVVFKDVFVLIKK